MNIALTVTLGLIALAALGLAGWCTAIEISRWRTRRKVRSLADALDPYGRREGGAR